MSVKSDGVSWAHICRITKGHLKKQGVLALSRKRRWGDIVFWNALLLQATVVVSKSVGLLGGLHLLNYTGVVTFSQLRKSKYLLYLSLMWLFLFLFIILTQNKRTTLCVSTAANGIAAIRSTRVLTWTLATACTALTRAPLGSFSVELTLLVVWVNRFLFIVFVVVIVVIVYYCVMVVG